MSRKRVLTSPGAAWVAAAVGAWLVAGACRSIQHDVPVSAHRLPAPSVEGLVEAPAVRVGILPEAPGVSIGAESGVRVLARSAGQEQPHWRPLARATFLPGTAEGQVRLVETGEDVALATVVPEDGAEALEADSQPYRGIMEVRPAADGSLTVVNVVNVEDYLRGVVPNELSPRAFPQIEALKAQAVAARTWVLAHLGDYSSRGYDVCATPACQVYRGLATEQPLTDAAVAETRGVVATWRGRPISAYYTSTCGGHTEDGDTIFDDRAPYLRGVVCAPERSARHRLRTTTEPRRDLPGSADVPRSLAVLEALGVVDGTLADPRMLAGVPDDDEVRDWMRRLRAALGRTDCEIAPTEGLARRAAFVSFTEASLCWREGVELPSGSPDGGGALTRAEMLDLLTGITERADAPGWRRGEFAGLADGQLTVLAGEEAESLPLDTEARLFRSFGGVHAGTTELTLTIGDELSYVARDGRVVYLEAHMSRRGEAAAHQIARHYRWERRLTPADVARRVARYGSVGEVRDIVPRKIGVSGRVVELEVRGTAGDLLLRGLRVRWGLGLRENLFVIDRETGADGEVEGFVISGKGWGHGVGLCQVGAFGMAQAGATFEGILKHYYTGIRLTSPAPPVDAAPTVEVASGPVPGQRL